MIKISLIRIKQQFSALLYIIALYFLTAIMIFFILTYIQGGISSINQRVKYYENNNYYIDSEIIHLVGDRNPQLIKYEYIEDIRAEYDMALYSRSKTLINADIYSNLLITTDNFEQYGIFHFNDNSLSSIPPLLAVDYILPVNQDKLGLGLVINEELLKIIQSKNIDIYSQAVTIEETEYIVKGIITLKYPNMKSIVNPSLITEDYKAPMAIIIDNNNDNLKSFDSIIMKDDFPSIVYQRFYQNNNQELYIKDTIGSKVKSYYINSFTLFYLFFNIMSIIPYILTLILIISNYNLLITTRQKEIAIKRISGAKLQHIFLDFYLENLLLSIPSTIIGIIIGAIFANLFLNHNYQYSYFSLASALVLLIYIIIIGLISSYIATRKAFNSKLTISLKESE